MLLTVVCLTGRAALEVIVESSRSTVQAGLVPSAVPTRASCSPPAWTAEQFKTVLRVIATSPYKAVQWWELKKALRSDGAAALKSLVEHEMLVVRPYSCSAQDLPEEVFRFRGSDLHDDVVTMPTPGRRYVALQMFNQGLLEPSAPPTC